MKRCVYIFLITFVLHSAPSAIELALNNRGIEFGLNGRKHLKLLLAGEYRYFHNTVGSDKVSDIILTTYVQYLNVGKNQFHLKFLSGIGFEIWNSSDNRNDIKFFDINCFTMEPEIFINEHTSLYIRGNIVAYSVLYGLYFGLWGYHGDPNNSNYTKMPDMGNIPVYIGLRYKF